MNRKQQEDKKNEIGTLNEKPLHESLKQWYAQEGDRIEVPVDGYVVDIVRGDLLIEIQTGSFSAIRSKLAKLLDGHRVRLVYPVAGEKWIIRQDDSGEISRRKSPKQGTFLDIFSELIYAHELIKKPSFELEVLLVQQEELRHYDGVRGWRRRGWVIDEHRLVNVIERRILKGAEDIAALLPSGLPEAFTTTDVAAASGQARRLAQKMVYCLRKAGCIRPVDKRGNAILYSREK